MIERTDEKIKIFPPGVPEGAATADGKLPYHSSPILICNYEISPLFPRSILPSDFYDSPSRNPIKPDVLEANESEENENEAL